MNLQSQAASDALVDIVNQEVSPERRRAYWNTVVASLEAEAEELLAKREMDVEREEVGLTDTAWAEDQQFSPRG
jgi:hypothetical protein